MPVTAALLRRQAKAWHDIALSPEQAEALAGIERAVSGAIAASIDELTLDDRPDDIARYLMPPPPGGDG